MEHKINDSSSCVADLDETINVVDGDEGFGKPYEVKNCTTAVEHKSKSGPITADSGNIVLQPLNSNKPSYSKRRILRNTGQEYVSASGKIVPKRQPRQLESCRNKCKEVITKDIQQRIFDYYWSLSTYIGRQIYAANLIEVYETKTIRRNKSLTNPRNRQFTYKYFLEVNNKKVVVCQKCFRSTLCESEQFINTLIKKKQDAEGDFSGSDERGKHASHMSAEKQSELMQMINEFSASKKLKPENTEDTASSDELQISKSYKIKFEKIGNIEVLTRKRVYSKKCNKN